ncbi:MAG: LPS assembly protein LptD [Magnetococcus sp. DMHC-8]
MNYNTQPTMQYNQPVAAPGRPAARRGGPGKGDGLLATLAVLLAGALLALPANAEEPLSIGHPLRSSGRLPSVRAQTDALDRVGLSAQEKKTPIDVDADGLDIDQENRVVTAKGNVRIVQTGLLELRADQAQYRMAANQVEASGHIRLARKGDLFGGERVVFDIGKQTGTFQKVDVNLRGPGGLASAESAEFHSEGEGKDFLFLKNASFTNCECENPPWHLTSKEVEIDRASNRITAAGVRLYAGDVPVFALPWWRQPLLPKRESGLLAPYFRAGGNGLEAELPYYWNIAPNRDATMAVRAISRRGLMTSVQYRYLDQDFIGKLDTSGIYDTVTEEFRGLATFDHEQKLAQWKMQAHLEGSRTRGFINDFEQKLVDPHSRRLESAVTANRMWTQDQGYANLQAGVRWYQDLEQSNDDHTVQNLPFVILTDSRLLKTRPISGEPLNPALGRWRLENEARLENFYQLAGDVTQRVDLYPMVRFERPVAMGNVSAALGVRETAYLLKGDPNQTGLDRQESLHREAAMAAVQFGTQLSRMYGSSYLHTLEPSVQYVWNTASDQSRLPNYDASLRNFSTTDIFAHNLYSGIDRISDAQWLGYRLTSRLLNRTDANAIWDSALFTIGQRWAPEGNREYQEGNAFSSVVSNLDVKLSDRVSATAMMGFNPYRNNVESSDLAFAFALADQERRKTTLGTETEFVRVGHHFNDSNLSLIPTSPTLPGLAGFAGLPGLPASLAETSRERVQDVTVDASLRLADAWIWDQKASYSLETSGLKSWNTGLVYEHSCWNLRLTGGRNISSAAGALGGNFIGLFINLQGLGGVGI